MQTPIEERAEALVLGIGNVLWADEGFGVRAVEMLHEQYAFAPSVLLMDGGTLGLNLLEPVMAARRVLVFDAIDFGLAPGTLRVLRDAEVPAWGARKLSPHQTGFNDVLALAQLKGRAPEAIVAIGVQPVELADFGGSLRPQVKAQLANAVAIAADVLAQWGLAGTRRAQDAEVEPLNARSLALDAYEAQRPSAVDACRVGDERLLVRTRGESAA